MALALRNKNLAFEHLPKFTFTDYFLSGCDSEANLTCQEDTHEPSDS